MRQLRVGFEQDGVIRRVARVWGTPKGDWAASVPYLKPKLASFLVHNEELDWPETKVYLPENVPDLATASGFKDAKLSLHPDFVQFSGKGLVSGPENNGIGVAVPATDRAPGTMVFSIQTYGLDLYPPATGKDLTTTSIWHREGLREFVPGGLFSDVIVTGWWVTPEPPGQGDRMTARLELPEPRFQMPFVFEPAAPGASITLGVSVIPAPRHYLFAGMGIGDARRRGAAVSAYVRHQPRITAFFDAEIGGGRSISYQEER